MKLKVLFLFTFLLIYLISVNAQVNAAENTSKINKTVQPINPLDNISQEISKISKSLQTFNKRIKELTDKLTTNQESQLNEKQQKILLAFEILNRAEQRLQILQKFQIELVEKETPIRARLAQIEFELKPESIDRSVSLIGTTKTEELRENRRQTLQAERISLQNLLAQYSR
jgi:Skp family chaperone for outer membrane proteins